jgi:vanillate monooxygenase ferredoxin subunit
MENPKLDVRVVRRIDEAEGIVSIELACEDGQALPAFAAGAHIDVHLGNGLVRQYSLCNDPAERHRYLLGILREPASRGGSEFVHAALREGARLTIGAPRCNFPLVEAVQRSILLAGGIGVTPLLAMAHRLAALGQDFTLHYCARSLSRVAFRDVLQDGPLARRAYLHLDDGAVSQRFDFDWDVGPAMPETHLYICGPDGFIRFVAEAAALRGWPKEQIHVEYFGAQSVGEAGDKPFTVTAARSGKTVEVGADQTIAQALTDAGFDIALSCEQGICGTCLTTVLKGEPLHRDDCLTDAERQGNKLMAICCSRAKSATLVLDL